MPILAPLQQGQFPAGGTLVLRRLATPHLVRLLGEWRGGGTTYLELAGALRALTVEGRLPPHTRLPSERALAAALGVSRNTATAALGVLREQARSGCRPRGGRRCPSRRPWPADVARPGADHPGALHALDLALRSSRAPGRSRAGRRPLSKPVGAGPGPRLRPRRPRVVSRRTRAAPAAARMSAARCWTSCSRSRRSPASI